MLCLHVSSHIYSVTRRLWVNDERLIPILEREEYCIGQEVHLGFWYKVTANPPRLFGHPSGCSQVPWPASHWTYKPGSWVRQGSNSQRLCPLRYRLLFLEPSVRQVVSVAGVSAIYQASNLMGWQEACLNVGKVASCLEVWNVTSKQLGNILGGVKGRDEKIPIDPFIEMETIPSTHGMQRKGHTSHLLITLRLPFGTILYLLPSALEKVFAASRLTQCLAPTAWPLHLQLYYLCIDGLTWRLSLFICKERG